MAAATLQRIPFPEKWISHREYNALPPVEKARERISVEKQKKVTQELSKYLLNTEETKKLVGQIGTFIPHMHHPLRKDQRFLGEIIIDGSFISKPTSLEEGKIAIKWIVDGEGLIPMEGIKVSLEKS